MRSRPIGGLFLLSLLLATGVAAVSEPRPAPESARPPAQVYRSVLHGVAWVHAAGSGKGTGWIIDRERRWLVTCLHVVGDAESVEVVFPVAETGHVVAARAWYLEHYSDLVKSGHVVRGKVLRRRRDVDLALVEVESLPADAVALTVAAEDVAPGDRVFVVGTRYDSDALWGFTTGTVRGMRVMREGYFSGARELAKGACVIEATAPINEGDSGGPLVNDRGEVVGVAAAVEWKAHGAGLFANRRNIFELLGQQIPETPTTQEQPSLGFRTYTRAVPAVALVQGADARTHATGWVVDRQRRLLLTTADFAGRQQKLVVTFPDRDAGRVVAEAAYYRANERKLRDRNRRIIGCVLATDPRRNLALLELAALPGDVPELALGATVPEPGEAVHWIGHPLGTETLWLYNGGWVRQLGHANLGQTSDGPDPAVILVQAGVGDGEGGAPLLDDKGEVIGVVTGKGAAQQQIAYALTAAETRNFLAEKRAFWQPRTTTEWCARADVFVKARLYDRAVLDLSAAIEAEPTSALACSERAHVQHLRGRDDLALADAERAIKLDGKRTSAYVHRASVHIDRGEFKQAIADCDTALSLEAGNTLAHSVRAEARRQLGDLDRALADADEAIWRDRKQPSAYLTRGLILAQKGDHARAIAEYGKALVLDSELAAAYRARADSQWARSDVAAALDDYNRALVLNADDALSLHGRGRARAARKEFDAALADFDAAIHLAPGRAAPRLDRGAELLRRGQDDRAFADFAAALRLTPNLVGDVLLVAERKASDLLKDGAPAMAFARCRRTLLLIRPYVQNRPEARVVEAGLVVPLDPLLPAVAAEMLRDLLREVRGLLRE